MEFRVSSRFSSSLGAPYNRNGDDWQFYNRYGAVVWQQGRNNYLTPSDPAYNGNYAFGRDSGSAFRDHPNNTFLIKWSYWLNP